MAGAQIGYEEGRRRQLRALTDTVARVADAGDALRSEGEIALVGIGASYAALATPLHVLRSAGRSAWRSDCSDLPAVLAAGPDIVVALSQGGRSVETNAVVERFAASGVATLAVTNADDSPLGAAAGSTLTLGGGADSRVSTVGFVTTYTALSLLVEAATGATPSIPWSELPAVVDATVQEATPALRAFARQHLGTGSVDVTASSDQLTAAEASALLLREGPLVASAAYGTRAYLHGPMDAAGPGLSHVVIGAERERQLVDQLEERSSAILLLAERQHLRAGSGDVALPPHLTEAQRALVAVCVLQQLVAESALVRESPVDDAVFVRQDTKLAVG